MSNTEAENVVKKAKNEPATISDRSKSTIVKFHEYCASLEEPIEWSAPDCEPFEFDTAFIEELLAEYPVPKTRILEGYIKFLNERYTCSSKKSPTALGKEYREAIKGGAPLRPENKSKTATKPVKPRAKSPSIPELPYEFSSVIYEDETPITEIDWCFELTQPIEMLVKLLTETFGDPHERTDELSIEEGTTMEWSIACEANGETLTTFYIYDISDEDGEEAEQLMYVGWDTEYKGAKDAFKKFLKQKNIY